MKELEKAVPMKAEQVDGVETYAINFVAKEELLEPVCVGDFVRTQMRCEKENNMEEYVIVTNNGVQTAVPVFKLNLEILESMKEMLRIAEELNTEVRFVVKDETKIGVWIKDA